MMLCILTAYLPTYPMKSDTGVRAGDEAMKLPTYPFNLPNRKLKTENVKRGPPT